MKKIKIFSIVIAAFLVGFAFIFTACEPEDNKVNYKAANENAYAEAIFGDVFSQSDERVRDTAAYKNGYNTNSCPTIGIQSLGNDDWIITIDYGVACTGNDGNIRSGKIICNVNGKYRDSLSTVYTQLDNYYYNGELVEGSHTVTNMGHNAGGNLVYDVKVDSGKIHKSNGIIHWESQRQREWVAGEGSWINIWDDEYDITGYSTGTDTDGTPFTVTITNPLRVAVICKYIKSGTLVLQSQGGPAITVDYGSGACDGAFTVTVNGVTYNIVLS